MTWNKHCVHKIYPHKILNKGKHALILKYTTNTEPVIEWSEIKQYYDIKIMRIKLGKIYKSKSKAFKFGNTPWSLKQKVKRH